MKKIYSILAGFLLAASVLAQAPNKMSYQAVIRNNGDALITSTPVGMQISILQGSVTGTPVYVETQTPTSNANGLVTLEVGGGTVLSGAMATIDWSQGPYFIKTETDPTGGIAYTITGTSELMSVPYALFSANGTPGAQGPTGATGGYPVHTIGESYGGGIVFYVYDGGQHGLIAAASDVGIGVQWYNGVDRPTGATGDGLGSGAMNTAMIVVTQIEDIQNINFAAKVCADYSAIVNGVDYGDWYLPSKYELNLLYLQQTVVGSFANGSYWSSTEYNNSTAYRQGFNDGGQYAGLKDGAYYVRAVRTF